MMKKVLQRCSHCLLSLMCVLPLAGHANGYGESGSWGFQTNQDKVNKAYVLDMIEKKKNGYYNAIKSTYNYNTYIDKQVNCTLSAVTTGTSGTNGLEASTSSPVLNNTGTTAASGAANSASNGQSSSGALNSSVSGSSNSASTGQVAANGGVTDQVLNSQQSNSGVLTSSISSSSACAGTLP